MRMRARPLSAAVTALLALPPAAAATTYDDTTAVVAALRGSPVAVDSRATPPITPAEAAQLVAEIRLRDPGRIRIAYVTPQTVSAGGGLKRFTNDVADAVNRRGVTLVEAGADVYLVHSYDDADPVEAVNGAFDRTEDTAAPARQLLEVVRALAQVDPGPASDSGGGSGGAVETSVDVSGAVGALKILLLVLAGAVLVLLLWFVGGRVLRARRAGRAAEEALADRRAAANDALVQLGEAISDLDIDSEMPAADAAGTQSYAEATEAYTLGAEHLRHADSEPRLARAESTIARGLAAVERARRAFQGPRESR